MREEELLLLFLIFFKEEEEVPFIGSGLNFLVLLNEFLFIFDDIKDPCPDPGPDPGGVGPGDDDEPTVMEGDGAELGGVSVLLVFVLVWLWESISAATATAAKRFVAPPESPGDPFPEEEIEDNERPRPRVVLEPGIKVEVEVGVGVGVWVGEVSSIKVLLLLSWGGEEVEPCCWLRAAERTSTFFSKAATLLNEWNI